MTPRIVELSRMRPGSGIILCHSRCISPKQELQLHLEEYRDGLSSIEEFLARVAGVRERLFEVK